MKIEDRSNMEGVVLLLAEVISRGLDVSKPGDVDHSVASLQADVENLSMEERRLDEHIRDIKVVPCFQNETLIAVKAPHGTTLEVPDPDEAVDYPQRRYRIVLRSTMGPIDVYLVSQFEEKFEEINAGDVPPSEPSTSGYNEHPIAQPNNVNRSTGMELQAYDTPMICADAYVSQESSSGIMKIVPEVDSDADYWLQSEAYVSISDMWGTDSAIEWNDLDTVEEEYVMVNVNTPQPQSPLPPTGNTTGI